MSKKKKNSNCPISPTFDNVIIKRDVPPDKVGANSVLYLGEAHREPKTRSGIVLAVGPGRWVEDTQTRIRPRVKVGDRVLFGKYVGMNPKIKGETFLCLSESEILGKLTPEAFVQ